MRVILFLSVVFLLVSCVRTSPETLLEAESIIDPRDPLPWNQPGYFNSLEVNQDYAEGELIAVYRQQSVSPPNVDVAQGELRTALLNYLKDKSLPDDTIRLVDLNGDGNGDAVYTLRSTVPVLSVGTTPVCGQLIAHFVFTGISLKDAIFALNDLMPGGYLPQGNSLYGISPRGKSSLTGGENLLTPAFTVNQWAYPVANADPNARADKIKVAVLDTGVSPVGNMFLRNRANFVTLVANTNEHTTNTTDNFLPDGHGTGVAALIGSEDYGVAPGAYIVPVKVCDGAGVCDDITLSRGICYAQAVGADVINLSLGTLVNSPMVRQAIREVTSRGSLVVAASGNTNEFTGVLQNKPDYPAYWANFDGLLSVGAVDQNSEYGDFATANSRVELVAPGADLQLGNPLADLTGIESLSSIAGNRPYFEGTSFAAPFVAGAAANLYAKCSILKRNNLSGPRWIENTLKATATPWSPVSQDPAGFPSNAVGFRPSGIINIIDALSTTCP